jgi:hypothetical protein
MIYLPFEISSKAMYSPLKFGLTFGFGKGRFLLPFAL